LGPSGSLRPVTRRYARTRRIRIHAGISCPSVTPDDRPLPQRPSMVRKGSTVRVRQRALSCVLAAQSHLSVSGVNVRDGSRPSIFRSRVARRGSGHDESACCHGDSLAGRPLPVFVHLICDPFSADVVRARSAVLPQLAFVHRMGITSSLIGCPRRCSRSMRLGPGGSRGRARLRAE